MSLYATAVKKPVTTALVFVAIVIFGLFSLTRLSVDLLPEIETNTIMVMTSYAGASAADIEMNVSKPLENVLNSVSDLKHITSQSRENISIITLEFDYGTDIDVATNDVRDKLDVAEPMLPDDVDNPIIFKFGTNDIPIIILSVTAEESTNALYKILDDKVSNPLARISGVGAVSISGTPAREIQVYCDPYKLEAYGVSIEGISAIIAQENRNTPGGSVDIGSNAYALRVQGEFTDAHQMDDLVIGHKDNKTIYLRDVARIEDSIEERAQETYNNGKKGGMIVIQKQSGANSVNIAKKVHQKLPEIQKSLPSDVKLGIIMDTSTNILNTIDSLKETIFITFIIVMLVVFVFLGRWRATFIIILTIPISLIASFAYLLASGNTLNIISLSSLSIAIGMVVDDAIVVVENISRHIEEGMTPMQAALKGSHEIGFTILSMTSSLIAVFIPLLLMGGVVGKLFREFAVTLSVALAISMFVSLTLTPMLCSRLFRKDAPKPHRMPDGRRWPQTVVLDWISSGLRKLHTAYVASLGTVMKHKLLTMVILLLTIVGNVFLYITIDKGLFPDQDTGILFGMVRADQQTSFTQMDPKILRLSKMLEKDPAIEYVLASTGGGGFGSRNTGQFFIRLKPLDQRTETASQVANRLFALSKRMPGTSLFLMPVQDFRTGGRSANATYQYSIQSDDLATLRQWSTPIYKALSKLPELTSVDSDAETGGSEVKVIVDREAATRYGLNAREIDTFLNDAFAQRQIATQYKMLNQYYSVIGLDSSWTQDPSVLTRLFVVTSAGKQIPVSNFARIEYSTTPLSVDHEDQTATTTIAFNLADGVSLDTAKAAIDRTMASLGLPDSVHGSFAGTAATFQKTMGQIPLLILTAILVIYILLGILYESWIHPITILSTLPSAGIGALLLMEITGTQFTVIAFIGILLLIGIVKKNAILMVDFAIAAEREGRTPEEAIIEACRKRFRPILMTSCAAFFGAVPLLLQTGSNASFHRPLGIAICGGLVVSQILTLYTTPVVYVYLDRFGSWAKRLWRRFFKGNGTAAAVTAGK